MAGKIKDNTFQGGAGTAGYQEMGEDFILQKHSSAVWCLTGASWGDGGATVGKEAVFFF